MVFFASDTITIRRLRPFGASKQTYSATFTAYSADIQPASPDRVQEGFGTFGSVYEAWVETSCPIKESDQLSSNGKIYNVRGVEVWQGAGLLDSKHLILVSQDA